MVWRTARRLDAALAGREVIVCDVRWPSLATVDLTGYRVSEVVSRGKHLLCRLQPPDAGGGLTLHSHLRMEGSWHVHRTGEAWHARPADGIRIVIGNDTWTAVGHRFGMLDLVPTTAEDALVGHLGPDLLDPGWDERSIAAILANLAEAPDRALGEALLDQRVLAGVGTFYLSEALFLTGVTPWTPVGHLSVDRRARLVELLRRLLQVNAARGVQITTGDARRGRTHYVHARSGLPCLRCGGTVRVAPVGAAPRERTAFYCPVCQAGPAPTDDGGPQAPLGARPRGHGPGRGARRRSDAG